MFNRYWRSFPWYLQLLQLIILIAVMFSFFALGLGSVLLPKLTGYTLTQVGGISEDSPYMLKQAALLWQFLYSFGTFLLPPLLFAYATHPKPASYLGLKKPGRKAHWIIVPLLMLGLIPVLLQIGNWISMLPWGAGTRAEAQKLQELTEIMTTMPNAGEFVKIFLLMAVLPALGEEMFFRGLMMRFAAKRSVKMAFPIILSALMFAYIHANTYGFLSILIAGVVLALIYYWTGSLWLSILAHLLHNGVQITMIYLADSSKVIESMMGANEVPMPLFSGGLILAVAMFWLLWKNRTPLPTNWTEDYTLEEIMEEQK
jgi:membrane protease YdiL (CAAX protease family)